MKKCKPLANNRSNTINTFGAPTNSSNPPVSNVIIIDIIINNVPIHFRINERVLRIGNLFISMRSWLFELIALTVDSISFSLK